MDVGVAADARQVDTPGPGRRLDRAPDASHRHVARPGPHEDAGVCRDDQLVADADLPMPQSVQMTDAEDVAVERDRRVGLEGPHALRHVVRPNRRPAIGVAADVPDDPHDAGTADSHLNLSTPGADVQRQGVAADRERPLELPLDCLPRERRRGSGEHGPGRDSHQDAARRFLSPTARPGEHPVLHGAGQVALSWNDQVGPLVVGPAAVRQENLGVRFTATRPRAGTRVLPSRHLIPPCW